MYHVQCILTFIPFNGYTFESKAAPLERQGFCLFSKEWDKTSAAQGAQSAALAQPLGGVRGFGWVLKSLGKNYEKATGTHINYKIQ